MAITKCPFNSLIECVNHHRQEYENVKTPLAEHEARVAEIRLDFEHTRSGILQAEDQNTDPEDCNDRILELAMECGRELEKLDHNFKAVREQEEIEYERAITRIYKANCTELIELLGVTLVGECLQHVDEAQPSQQQENLTPERDAELQGQTAQCCRATLCKSFSKKRRVVDSHVRIPSKRIKLATPERHEVSGEPTRLRHAILRPARNRNRQSERHPITRNGANAERHHGISTSVVPGRIYRAWYNSWYLALLLPTHNLEDVGVPETMQSLGLTKNVPECYAYDSQTQAFSWEKQYEDGGELESERSYPVMYFDGTEFPERASVSWVKVHDLREYDMTGPRDLLEHHKQAELYLEQMKSSQPNSISSLQEPDSQFFSDSRKLLQVNTNGNTLIDWVAQNNEATDPERSSSRQSGTFERHAALEQDRASTVEAIDSVSTAEQEVRDIHEESKPSPITGDRISLDRETTPEADGYVHYNSTPRSPSHESDTADLASASEASLSTSQFNDNSSRVFSTTYLSQEFQSDGAIPAQNGKGNAPARLPPTTDHSAVRMQPIASNFDNLRQSTDLNGSIASETAISGHQQMLERFPPPATIYVAGNMPNFRLPPIQSVWGRMPPMHTQLTPGPAPAPAPATITKTHYQTSAHPLYRKLLPRTSLSNEVPQPMAPVFEWDSPLPRGVVELLRQHTRGHEPTPNMFLKNSLYHCVLCRFEAKTEFARVKVFRKHLVEKHSRPRRSR